MEKLFIDRKKRTLKNHKSQSCLIIGAKYDAELIKNIKVIDRDDRTFEKPFWIVLEDDPNQSEDEMTNLEWIRKICSETCDRRGWLLVDRTAHTREEIEAKEREIERQKEIDLQSQKQKHLEAIEEILPKLPNNCLKLVSWDKDLIKVQLQFYIEKDLWLEFKNACNKIWKPQALMMSSEQRMNFSYVFEIANDRRSIIALMGCKGVKFLEVIEGLKLVRYWQDDVNHFIDSENALWIGYAIEKANTSEFNWGSNSWQVARVSENIYWVAFSEEFICDLLEQPSHNRLLYAFIPRYGTVARVICDNHLEDWFADWGATLLNAKNVIRSQYHPAHSIMGWDHPADLLLQYAAKFKYQGAEDLISLLNLSLEEFSSRAEEIRNLKKKFAQTELEKFRSKAIDTVVSRYINKYSKEELLKKASNVRPSWNKEKIARSFINQEFAEKELMISQDIN